MEDITVTELKQRLDKGDKPIIIDVREIWEYEEFNIGARNIPLGTLPEAMFDILDLKNKEIIVHCRSGARSSTAKAYLLQNGFTKVRNLIGGMIEWQEKIK